MIRTAMLSFLAMNAGGHKHTRAVEYMLAWLMIGWGSMLAFYPGDILVGPTYQYLLTIAHENTWSALALGVGGFRLAALVINGAWRRSPLIRFVGAAFGLLWWTVLGGLFWLSVMAGGAAFPNLMSYVVFVYFEAYSCYRCGQDASCQNSFNQRRAPGSEHGTNG